jgi:hypothetical protein
MIDGLYAFDSAPWYWQIKEGGEVLSSTVEPSEFFRWAYGWTGFKKLEEVSAISGVLVPATQVAKHGRVRTPAEKQRLEEVARTAFILSCQSLYLTDVPLAETDRKKAKVPPTAATGNLQHFPPFASGIRSSDVDLRTNTVSISDERPLLPEPHSSGD